MKMKVLVACEFSGIVRNAFSNRGHDAVSCDLLPTEQPGKHVQGDVCEILNDGWDLMIAHPPCTFIANSGARWLFEKEGRWKQLEEATTFFKTLLNAPIEKIAVENPMPHKWGMQQIGRKYDQRIQPWQFGEPQKKGICLWLKNLPLLEPTDVLELPKRKEELKKWERVWREPPGKEQWKNRSRFYPKIAEAMAEQWGR
jgi:hypothetical protein